MLIIPPCCYAEVGNPIQMKDGKAMLDKNNQCKL